MSENWLARTELLIGDENIAKLKNAHVLIAGLGGVGAYSAEQICRAGVGKMTIVDHDIFSLTNRNRQLPALISTEGKYKADVVAERLKDINPDLDLNVFKTFLKDDAMIDVLKSFEYDYVIDAIDTLSPKLFLIYHAQRFGLPVVSSMGSGGRLDPTQIRIADISESYGCRLAYYIRKKLHTFGVKSGIDVVFSPEQVNREAIRLVEEQNKKSVVGTISYMTAIFGCYCASIVINKILEK